MNLMKIDEFEYKWHSIADVKGSYQRIDADHPLDFFIGKDADGFKELILVTQYEPAKMKSSKSVEVLKGIRTDGKWAIQIRLLKKEHEDVFVHLCWDLIEASRGVLDDLKGLETVIMRFIKWQKLMEYGSGGMADEVIKGVLGELIYAKRMLVNKYDFDTIIESWLGPDGADRDFVFKDTWVEVKAIRSGKQTISINSLEQLDTPQEGVIAVVTLDETSPSDENAFSFAGVINDFRAMLKASPNALFKFEDKLVSLGYYDRKEYEEKFYTCAGLRFFRVDGDFPRLTREMVRNEIVMAKYEILFSAIGNWETEVV